MMFINICVHNSNHCFRIKIFSSYHSMVGAQLVGAAVAGAADAVVAAGAVVAGALVVDRGCAIKVRFLAACPLLWGLVFAIN